MFKFVLNCLNVGCIHSVILYLTGCYQVFINSPLISQLIAEINQKCTLKNYRTTENMRRKINRKVGHREVSHHNFIFSFILILRNITNLHARVTKFVLESIFSLITFIFNYIIMSDLIIIFFLIVGRRVIKT